MNARLLFRFRWLAIIFLFSATVWSADNVTVQNTTYTSGQFTTVQAGVSITASPNVVVNNGAGVVFKAGERVSLGIGFKVVTGGAFRVWIKPIAADNDSDGIPDNLETLFGSQANPNPSTDTNLLLKTHRPHQ